MNMRVVYLNGPPGCGKDTIANALRLELGPNMIHEKFANPIRFAIEGMGVPPAEFERIKNEPDQFHGLRWRDVAISFSEDWAKRRFGKGVFGELAAMRISNVMRPNHQLVVISDCGFVEELHTCEHGLRNFAMSKQLNYWSLMMNIRRPGHSFKGDSRGLVGPQHGMAHAEIENDADEATLVRRAVMRIKVWLEG